jgi:hypothetical protein
MGRRNQGPRLRYLKKRRAYTTDIRPVLHRRELMSREGVFAALNDDHLRAQFDARFAALVAEVPAPAFTISIDKQGHLEKIQSMAVQSIPLRDDLSTRTLFGGRSGFFTKMEPKSDPQSFKLACSRRN